MDSKSLMVTPTVRDLMNQNSSVNSNSNLLNAVIDVRNARNNRVLSYRGDDALIQRSSSREQQYTIGRDNTTIFQPAESSSRQQRSLSQSDRKQRRGVELKARIEDIKSSLENTQPEIVLLPQYSKRSLGSRQRSIEKVSKPEQHQFSTFQERKTSVKRLAGSVQGVKKVSQAKRSGSRDNSGTAPQDSDKQLQSLNSKIKWLEKRNLEYSIRLKDLHSEKRQGQLELHELEKKIKDMNLRMNYNSETQKHQKANEHQRIIDLERQLNEMKQLISIEDKENTLARDDNLQPISVEVHTSQGAQLRRYLNASSSKDLNQVQMINKRVTIEKKTRSKSKSKKRKSRSKKRKQSRSKSKSKKPEAPSVPVLDQTKALIIQKLNKRISDLYTQLRASGERNQKQQEIISKVTSSFYNSKVLTECKSSNDSNDDFKQKIIGIINGDVQVIQIPNASFGGEDEPVPEQETSKENIFKRKSR